jgi:hypothetical protein
MGASGVDIKMSPLARRTFPLSLECKKTKKTPSLAEMKQARANTYGLTLAAVCWCPHGSGPHETMIMMNLEEFIDWYKEQVCQKS